MLSAVSTSYVSSETINYQEVLPVWRFEAPGSLSHLDRISPLTEFRLVYVFFKCIVSYSSSFVTTAYLAQNCLETLEHMPLKFAGLANASHPLFYMKDTVSWATYEVTT